MKKLLIFLILVGCTSQPNSIEKEIAQQKFKADVEASLQRGGYVWDAEHDPPCWRLKSNDDWRSNPAYWPLIQNH